MTLREASCPGCGATLEFLSPATLLVVCPYCDSASTRSDVDLTLVGKVAAVADLDSVLGLGATGRHAGQAWTAVGFVQYDHGAGPWNEWALVFDDGATAWLAEAQGQLLLSREVEPPEGPARTDLRPGLEATIGDASFVVAEVGEGRVVSARGELPSDVRLGAVFAYADLRGAGGAFATLGYGEGEAPDQAFVGALVTVEALGIDRGSVPERTAKTVGAARLACPSCGQSIDLSHPDEAQRVGCASCGALVDPSSRTFEVAKHAAALKKRPVLPLGSRLTLRGVACEVLALLVRSVTVEGERYAWSEYLLRASDGGYRWLVLSNGHWSLVEPVELGETHKGPREATLGRRTFRHFQGGEARVDLVLGEVYWAVSVGETVSTDDYVDPPEMLSFETSGKERVASLGHYLPREELAAAVGPGVVLPVPIGVAPHQPNPLRPARRVWWRMTGLAVLVTVALWVVFAVRAEERVVYRVERHWTKAAAPAAPPAPPGPAVEGPEPGPVPAPAAPNVEFSDPFVLTAASANLRVRLDVPGLENGWLGLEGALVDEASGEVRAFGIVAERWSGVEDGESWSEGDRDPVVYLGRVPAGRYSLRLEADGDAGTGLAPAAPVRFTVEVTSQVPSHGRPLLLLLLLVLPALVVSLRSWGFEKRRWAESDHAE